jgi:hypothetical protein
MNVKKFIDMSPLGPNLVGAEEWQNLELEQVEFLFKSVVTLRSHLAANFRIDFHHFSNLHQSSHFPKPQQPIDYNIHQLQLLLAFSHHKILHAQSPILAGPKHHE